MMLKITTNFKQGIDWSLAVLIMIGLFGYLAFIPRQTFAESLIVDPDEKRSLSDISTMQEMSQQICINSRENETKQLRDTRVNNDGKTRTYWVTKLKDGNCWMTQNLDFDGGGIKTQDLTMWDGATGTGHVNNATAAYYDPDADLSDGQRYYYNGPEDNPHAQGTYCANTTGLGDCGEFSTADADDHYLVGNYYSWPAAMNGDTSATGNVQGVCPNGWRLPTGGDGTGEFRNLMLEYGWTADNPSDAASAINNGKGVWSNPLYLVYSGSLVRGQLDSAGRTGHYWSSTPYSGAEEAYYLYLTSAVGPSNKYYRYFGKPIRCLTTGGWLDSYPELLANNQANISVTVSPVISIDATSSMAGEVDFTTIARGDISATISSNQNYKVLLGTSQSTLEQDPKLTNHNIPMVENDQSITAGLSRWGVRKLTNSSDIKKELITDEYNRTITQVTVNTADTNITNTTATGTTISTSANYSPIGLFAVDSDNNTIKDNSILFYDAGTSGISRVVFPVAIAVDAQLLGGKYFTEVVITAVAN